MTLVFSSLMQKDPNIFSGGANLHFIPSVDAKSRLPFIPRLPAEALMHGRVKDLPLSLIHI